MKNYSTYVGRILDRRYKLLDFCGSGASGAVFRAYDAQERREVAIKLFGADDDMGSANLSFMTEARAIAALAEEHIVRLHDTGVEGSECYLVMEYVDGTTLREYLNSRKSRGQKVPCSEILSCARQILLALSAAHAKEIVHRDIKPQNVILTKTGILKVTDFGVAKFAGYDAFDGDRYAIGTAYYISPEQAAGNIVDARSDIYSLGVLLYEMATGVLPFSGNTPSEIVKRQVTDTPAPPRTLDPEIPLGLEQVILTAIQKDPDRRFSNAAAMLRAIDKLSKNPSYVFGDFTERPLTRTGMRRTAARTTSLTPVLIASIAGFTAVIFALALFLASRGTGKRDVTVPDLYGTFYNESHTYEGITVTVEYAYSSTVPEGCVIGQSLRPGVYADRVAMTLTVSRGKEPIARDDIPTALAEAKTYLASKGVVVAGVRYVASENAVLGTIVDIICEDDVLTAGSIVLLTVSSGSATATEMPTVVGETLSDALAVLDAAGILYKITVEPSDTVPEGTVISATVVAGAAVSVGVSDAVTITVSGGIRR